MTGPAAGLTGPAAGETELAAAGGAGEPRTRRAVLPRRRLRARTRRELDRRLREAQVAWRSPGVSAGVSVDGRLAWSGHVGSARLDPPLPADDGTQFLTGSVTKTFGALLVMMLRDEGRLGLEDRLDAHLRVGRHGSLTLRQLLSHTSGLQREPPGRIWETLDTPDADRLLADLTLAEQVLPAQAAFHYSNLAFALLGQVVERVTGTPWASVLDERLVRPLGLTGTGLSPDPARAAWGYLVHPYAATARREPLMEPRATAALGGLWSTVADLSRYAAFLAEPDPDVIAPATVEEMCGVTVMSDRDRWRHGYGLGVQLFRSGELILAGHGGAMPGFLTGLRVARSERVAAVVFANTTAGAEPGELAASLVTAVLDEQPAVPAPWVPSPALAGLDPLLGSWWSEGEQIVLEIRDGRLWARLPADPDPLRETRFVADGPDRFRAAEGRERGELLEVVRGEDGTVLRLYFATYPLTREPASFAELSGLAP